MDEGSGGGPGEAGRRRWAECPSLRFRLWSGRLGDSPRPRAEPGGGGVGAGLVCLESKDGDKERALPRGDALADRVAVGAERAGTHPVEGALGAGMGPPCVAVGDRESAGLCRWGPCGPPKPQETCPRSPLPPGPETGAGPRAQLQSGPRLRPPPVWWLCHAHARPAPGF